MNSVKILHCSDFHFDTVFSDLTLEKAEQRREDIRENLGSIIELAKEEKVNFILIAGDMFDNTMVRYETITYIRDKFCSIPETQIFISPGNHDALTERSFYKDIIWPDNVHIFTTEMQCFSYDELNADVYGRAFSESYERESFLNNFKASDENRINIMCIHGDFTASSNISDYNAVTTEHISNSKLDYLALGHIHSYSGINKSGDTLWAYSGCPEGRGFDEQGDKGVLVGEIYKGHADLRFVKTCKRVYLTYEVDITGAENYDNIMTKIIDEIEKNMEYQDVGEAIQNMSQNLCQIVLKGRIKKEFKINKSILEEKLLRKFYYAKLLDKTDFEVDYEAISKEYTLRGIFVKKMLQKIQLEEDENEKISLLKALNLGLDVLEQKEVTTNDY
ncbi:metallophosphoesterase family protein [Clostridium oryzae]|uniref:Putative metallophosphoesterase YhaO n=1 Tax=Clostridium oryzae TaxID=1450648 RepID=A0A1V4IP35_9CLOT|nr:DNA repair exonuclease [Clostridium oryzae]OPJ61676.1 putative metallophosphoesterase YhaO [Clostridium oryzae]